MLLFSDKVNGSVQNVDIIWVVVHLRKQNHPLGDISIDSATPKRYLFCNTYGMSFLSIRPESFSFWTSSTTHMSAVHVLLPLTTLSID